MPFQSGRPPRPRGKHAVLEAFGEDATSAAWLVAAEPPRGQVETDAAAGAWQIGDVADVPAVHAPRQDLAKGDNGRSWRSHLP